MENIQTKHQTIRSRQELEKEVYNILSRMWEFPIIQKGLQETNGDVEKAINLICCEDNGFCIFGGVCSRGHFDHEVSLLKGGYFHLWEPENEDIMTRKPDLVMNMTQIFRLIKNGPSNQMELF